MASEADTATDLCVAEKELSIPGEDKRLDTKEDVADIVKSIEECEGLTALRLSGNSLGVEAASAIADALSRKPTLSRALWSDMFVSRLKSEIPPALTALGDAIIASQAQLVELDLSDNAFGPRGPEALATLLTNPSCYSLKVLKFNNNGLGIGGGKILARALLECHEEAKKAGSRLALEVFVAGRNRLEDQGAAAFSEVFEALGSLLHVSMPQNGIQYEGICTLAKSFSKNPKLQVIDLNDNTFTEPGSAAMAEVLPGLQELRVLNFGECLVRSGGATAIAEAIKDGHKLLEEVDLSYGELDQDSALAVAQAMADKEHLKKIDLNGNCLGEDGIELLREVLEAKGCIDALGSLSDDEGLESDEEEEEGGGESGEEEEEEGTEGEVSTDERLRAEGTAITPERPSPGSMSGPSQQESRTVTLEDYLACPSGDNLLALGEGRALLLASSLGDHPNIDRTAHLYARVTSCYCESCPGPVRRAVEQTVDAVLQPVSEAGQMQELVNGILVQIGLIKVIPVIKNKTTRGILFCMCSSNSLLAECVGNHHLGTEPVTVYSGISLQHSPSGQHFLTVIYAVATLQRSIHYRYVHWYHR